VTIRGVAAAAALTTALALTPGAACAAAPPRPTALDWGGRYFVSQAAFVHWLSDHDGDFGGWARRHPAALATLAHASRVPLPLSTADLPKAVAQHAPDPLATGAAPAAHTAGALEAVLAALAVVLLLLAAAPVGIRFRRSGGWAATLHANRLVLAAAGMSLLTALAVVHLAAG
jgi:hypothetical protein